MDLPGVLRSRQGGDVVSTQADAEDGDGLLELLQGDLAVPVWVVRAYMRVMEAPCAVGKERRDLFVRRQSFDYAMFRENEHAVTYTLERC